MSRIKVLKTYKIFIGGKFPRTESGRYYQPSINGEPLGNICQSSRKDFRNAVVAARAAQSGWAGKTAYNRSQILYRIAEILEGRHSQFMEELQLQGSSKAEATREVNAATDRCIYYAGWCDKITQVFGSVNPVASSHFNFSTLEPTGVVSVIADKDSSLLGLVTAIMPVIAAGNTIVVLASENKPLCAVTLSEVISTSDVPGGVVNVLTGSDKELASYFSSHMDVNAINSYNLDNDLMKDIDINAVDNLKRVKHYSMESLSSDELESPYLMLDNMEVKTTWHPIEQISAAGSGY